MEPSLLTPKFTLVPSHFFDPASARDVLAEVVTLEEGETVRYIEVGQYDAVLVYSDISGKIDLFPEMYFILRDLSKCTEYNKVLCTWLDGFLYIAIAQGKSLMLSNAFRASDFTTAEYFIFLAMKSLQLNPEVTTICWRTPLGPDEEMSLYGYFKSVELM